MCGIILECDFIGEIFHGEPEKLKECYYNSLKLAYDNNLHSIAFPSISTGAYGYPVEKAAEIAITTILAFVKKYSDYSFDIKIAAFDDYTKEVYEGALRKHI